MSSRKGRRRRRDAVTWERKIVALYRRGVVPLEIAARLELSPSAVYGHLRRAGYSAPYARTFLITTELPRPPFRGLHAHDGSSEIMLGRKFCTCCGRWRQLMDFRPVSVRGQRVPCPRCRACDIRRSLAYHARHRLDRLEYLRFYKEAKRREQGIAPSTARRPSVIDRVERVTLPLEPLLEQLERYDDGELHTLAARAGVSPRALYRYRYGESATVRIDVADKLAVAMGTTSSLLWGDDCAQAS